MPEIASPNSNTTRDGTSAAASLVRARGCFRSARRSARRRARRALKHLASAPLSLLPLTPFFISPFANPALYLLCFVIVAHHRSFAVDTLEPFYFRLGQEAPVTPFATSIV